MNVKSIKDVDLAELTHKIQDRVNTDYSYVSRLLADTEALIKRDFDVYAPDGTHIKVVAQLPEHPDENTVYIPITLPRGKTEDELSDQQLDLVAGGGQAVNTFPEEFLQTMPGTSLGDEEISRRAENIMPE